MLKENTFNLVYVIVSTVLILLLPYILPLLPFLKNIVLFLNNHHYFKLLIKVLLFSYLIQLSAVVHELGHAFIDTGGVEGKTHVPKTYLIPFYGYKETPNVFTTGKWKSTRWTGLAGFIPQIMYLLLVSLIFFKLNPLSVAIVSTGFIFYMFTHHISLNGGDFKYA